MILLSFNAIKIYYFGKIIIVIDYIILITHFGVIFIQKIILFFRLYRMANDSSYNEFNNMTIQLFG